MLIQKSSIMVYMIQDDKFFERPENWKTLNPNIIYNHRMLRVFENAKPREDGRKGEGFWEDDYFYTTNVHTNHKNFKIQYKLNKDGFRSNNFKNIDKNKYTVLFTGCSVTFGQDLPEEMLWTELVAKELSKKYNIDYYNLGIMGSSIMLCIKNISAFINIYGMPDLIIMLVPDTFRTISYDPVEDCYLDLTPRTKEGKLSMEQMMPENIFLQSIININLLQNLCNVSGSKFLFSAYDKMTQNIFDKFSVELPSFFKSECLINDKLNLRENDVQYWDKAADRKHPGGGWHELFAERVLKILKDNI
jgi:hypothetical protein